MFAVCASVCYAVPPHLACEEVFNRQDIRTEGHEVVSNRSEHNYYRSVTATNNPRLLSDIKKLIKQDEKRASNITEGYRDGQEYIILNIPSNGCIINVGAWWTDAGYVRMFIQSELKAFK